jgi:hypothetical protein
MGTKLLLVGVLILCTVTTAHGYVVGAVNGAAYFIGGPPVTNSNYASFGSSQAGGFVHQQATAFTPWGAGVVGQAAGAVGGQISGGPVQAQGVIAGMGQTAVKAGGSGSVVGTQFGGVGMGQTSHTGAMQGMSATGMQMSGTYGLGGIGSSSQSMCVGTLQVDVN